MSAPLSSYTDGADYEYNGNSSLKHVGVSTVAMVLLFGTVTFATAGLAARTWLLGDYRALLAATQHNLVAKPLEPTYISVYTFLHHLTIFGLLLLVVYVLENHPPFPHSNREHDEAFDCDNFAFLVILFLGLCLTTIRRNDGKKEGRKEGKSTGSAPAKKEEGQPQASSDSLSEQLVPLISDSASIASGSSHDLELTTESKIPGGNEDELPYPTKPINNDASNNLKELITAPVSPCNDLLNRHQTTEWKGFMEIIFLLLQYTNATSVPEWHNLQQVLYSAFLWISGFAHFTYFYKTKDFSLVRVIRVLWRVNFLAIFMGMTNGNTYLLYFVCPLSSYFFLMVYFSLRVGKHLNYRKYGLRLKLLGVALAIYLLWDVDTGLFKLLHFPFVTVGPPREGAPLGPMWEWYFRTSLNHWFTFLGMMFAANYPISSLFMRRLESRPVLFKWLSKCSIGVALLAALFFFVTGPLHYDVYLYNATHCYFGFIPILAWVYFRNIHPTMRECSIDFLQPIGLVALELYVLHHHILLSSNGRTLLTLVPGYPKCNFLLVALIYYAISRKFHSLTSFLKSMLLPDEERKCVKNIGCIAGVVFAFYGVAYSLNKMGIVNLGTLATITLISGILVYQTIMDTTWRAFRGFEPNANNTTNTTLNKQNHITVTEDEESFVAKISPPLIGTMIILLLGLSWQGIAIMSSGKVGPLPSTCANTVNKGQWVYMDTCSEHTKGIAQREFGISSFGHCSGTYIWGWNHTPINSHCRFTNRSERKLQEVLNHRSFVFIGDSITRNLFHAVCRALGDTTAGEYDATVPKHSDISRYFGDTSMEYIWAPLAIDELAKLKEFRMLPPGQGPDLVVIGGGAWDRLHVWATDEDQESHKNLVKHLANVMERLKTEMSIPCVWFTPTSIHTEALNNDEKRSHMSEKFVQDMRVMYAELGITNAASFVLDGASFTKDRVQESYDGVHYPHQVYDAGAQILANAMDWVLLNADTSDTFNPPKPGVMANPFLGLMMLCFALIGLLFFDGYMGFSFLASIFANGAMPSDLYEEAFAPLHCRLKLTGEHVTDDDMLGLLGGTGKGLELSSSPSDHHAR